MAKPDYIETSNNVRKMISDCFPNDVIVYKQLGNGSYQETIILFSHILNVNEQKLVDNKVVFYPICWYLIKPDDRIDFVAGFLGETSFFKGEKISNETELKAFIKNFLSGFKEFINKYNELPKYNENNKKFFKLWRKFKLKYIDYIF